MVLADAVGLALLHATRLCFVGVQKPDQPVGLRNLGNTCYVNSVLQCLFANQAFRRAVYAVRPPLSEQPVVKELRSAQGSL